MTEKEELESKLAIYSKVISQLRKEIEKTLCVYHGVSEKLDELKRIETLEKYKPLLEGYVDVYLDKPCSYGVQTRSIEFYECDFNNIVTYFKNHKESGYRNYLYSITECHYNKLNLHRVTGYIVKCAHVKYNGGDWRPHMDIITFNWNKTYENLPCG